MFLPGPAGPNPAGAPAASRPPVPLSAPSIVALAGAPAAVETVTVAGKAYGLTPLSGGGFALTVLGTAGLVVTGLGLGWALGNHLDRSGDLVANELASPVFVEGTIRDLESRGYRDFEFRPVSGGGFFLVVRTQDGPRVAYDSGRTLADGTVIPARTRDFDGAPPPAPRPAPVPSAPARPGPVASPPPPERPRAAIAIPPAVSRPETRSPLRLGRYDVTVVTRETGVPASSYGPGSYARHDTLAYTIGGSREEVPVILPPGTAATLPRVAAEARRMFEAGELRGLTPPPRPGDVPAADRVARPLRPGEAGGLSLEVFARDEPTQQEFLRAPESPGIVYSRFPGGEVWREPYREDALPAYVGRVRLARPEPADASARLDELPPPPAPAPVPPGNPSDPKLPVVPRSATPEEAARRFGVDPRAVQDEMSRTGSSAETAAANVAARAGRFGPGTGRDSARVDGAGDGGGASGTAAVAAPDGGEPAGEGRAAENRLTANAIKRDYVDAQLRELEAKGMTGDDLGDVREAFATGPRGFPERSALDVMLGEGDAVIRGSMGLKPFNDVISHEAGDRAIDALLDRVSAYARERFGEAGHVVDLGGGNFAVIAPAGEAEEIARDLKRYLRWDARVLMDLPDGRRLALIGLETTVGVGANLGEARENHDRARDGDVATGERTPRTTTTRQGVPDGPLVNETRLPPTAQIYPAGVPVPRVQAEGAATSAEIEARIQARLAPADGRNPETRLLRRALGRFTAADHALTPAERLAVARTLVAQRLVPDDGGRYEGTNFLNKTAFESLPADVPTAVADGDSIRLLDRIAPALADGVLDEIVRVMDRLAREYPGLVPFHFSGDEFGAAGASREALADYFDRVKAELRGASLSVTVVTREPVRDPITHRLTGVDVVTTRHTVTGIGLSSGPDDAALEVDKLRRLDRGERRMPGPSGRPDNVTSEELSRVREPSGAGR